jgi:hypothetical protein
MLSSREPSAVARCITTDDTGFAVVSWVPSRSLQDCANDFGDHEQECHSITGIAWRGLRQN